MRTLAKIIEDLKKRRELVDQAIAVLEDLGRRGRRGPGRPPKLTAQLSRRAVSSVTRQRMAEARRRWWEAKKAKAASA